MFLLLSHRAPDCEIHNVVARARPRVRAHPEGDENIRVDCEEELSQLNTSAQAIDDLIGHMQKDEYYGQQGSSLCCGEEMVTKADSQRRTHAPCQAYCTASAAK